MRNHEKYIQKNNGVTKEYILDYSNKKSKNIKAEKIIKNFISEIHEGKSEQLVIDFINNDLRKLNDQEWTNENIHFLIRQFINYSLDYIILNKTNRKFKKDSLLQKKLLLLDIQNEEEFFNEIFLEKVFSIYYTEKISGLRVDTIEKLKNEKLAGIDLQEISKEAQSELHDKINNNEIIANSIANAIDEVYDQEVPHLCFDCQNATALKCTKFGDAKLRNISQYSYIKKGYVIEKKGIIKKFVVQQCDNFKYVEPRRKTTNVLELRKAIDAIYEVYFDAETREEAIDKHVYMKKSGQIK